MSHAKQHDPLGPRAEPPSMDRDARTDRAGQWSKSEMWLRLSAGNARQNEARESQHQDDTPLRAYMSARAHMYQDVRWSSYQQGSKVLPLRRRL